MLTLLKRQESCLLDFADVLIHIVRKSAFRHICFKVVQSMIVQCEVCLRVRFKTYVTAIQT